MAFFVILATISNNIISIPLVAIWIAVISLIYTKTLYKEVSTIWGYILIKKQISSWNYLFRLGLTTFILWFVAQRIFVPLAVHPLKIASLSSNTKKTLVILFSNFKHNFLNQIHSLVLSINYNSYIEIPIAIGIGLVIMSIFIFKLFKYSPIITKSVGTVLIPLDFSYSRVFAFYNFVNRYIFSDNPWIRKDLILLQRLQINTSQPNNIELAFPPAIATATAFSLVLLYSHNSASFALSFWSITIILLYRTFSLWIWFYPTLNPSSELRQVNITLLSPVYRIGSLYQSKTKLLLILGLPFQITLNFLFVTGEVLLHASWQYLIMGLCGLWFLYGIVTILATWWMSLINRYDYPNIFAIRQDTLENKLANQLYKIPKRILSNLCLFLLVIAFLFTHSLDISLENSLFVIQFPLFFLAYYFYLQLKQAKEPTNL